jgi:hypothetical protein
MTNPDERRLLPVTLAGHEFTIKELTDVQIMHLNRHARILSREGTTGEARSEAADRMFTILHNCVADPADLDFLVGLEENGDVTLRDLVAFVNVSNRQEAEPPAVVRRRGRPRKSVS